jgi:hypothetical protein
MMVSIYWYNTGSATDGMLPADEVAVATGSAMACSSRQDLSPVVYRSHEK